MIPAHANGLLELPALKARWPAALLLLSFCLPAIAEPSLAADESSSSSYRLSEILESFRASEAEAEADTTVSTEAESQADPSVDDAMEQTGLEATASAGTQAAEPDVPITPAPTVVTDPPVEAPVVETATLTGRIRLSAGDRPLRASEAGNAIVYFRPAVPVAVQPLSEEQIMATRRKQFVPRALPITPGTRVRFPNNDPILHNTFSTVPGNEFDTGLYGQGDGIAHTFENVGHVRVYCNVHHSMIGHVLVLDTPFFTNPDATGAFRLPDVPLGEGELFVWHERSTLWRQPLDPANTGPLEIDIELSTRRVPQHNNKFGQPYRRRGDSEY